MKTILSENRIGVSTAREGSAIKIGGVIGSVGGLAVSPAASLALGSVGATIGYALATASNKKIISE